MTLHIRNLHHRFGLTEVLDGIQLDLEPGQTLALVGPSGCGKSTLLHIVAGLLDASEGEVISSFKRTACVFQQPRLMPWKNVLDNIALGLKASGMPSALRRHKAGVMAQLMGLDATTHRLYPHELSGGMQSRVALARALVLEPDLVLLDEPFSALDIGLKLGLYQVLQTQVRSQGCAVLMITHDLMEAVRLADVILMMAANPGRILRAFALGKAQQERSDAWIHHNTALLLQDAAIRCGFELPPLPESAITTDTAQDHAGQTDIITRIALPESTPSHGHGART